MRSTLNVACTDNTLFADLRVNATGDLILGPSDGVVYIGDTAINGASRLIVTSTAGNTAEVDFQSGVTTTAFLYRPASSTDLRLDSSTTNFMQYWTNAGLVGFGTGTPRMKVDSLYTSGAQFRATYTDNSVYTDIKTESTGLLSILSTGNIIEQKNSTSAQTLRIYNTFTDTSNFERAIIAWSSNVFVIGCSNTGSGSARDMAFQAANVGNAWLVKANTARFASAGNFGFQHGTSALATNATEGFFMLQSCAGAPTGVPASIPTGQIPAIVDSTNNFLYLYIGGAWKKSTVYA
jgi:hypothetical protein